MQSSGDSAAVYPLSLKLAGRKCVVVGGGAIAARKVKPLLVCGAKVAVVSPELSPELEELAAAGRIVAVRRTFEHGDVAGALLVIAAVDDGAVNAAVCAAARTQGALVNVVDRPELCDFYVPAVVRRGSLSLAVSTGGNCPALAKRLREELDRQFGPHYEEYAALLGRVRAALAAGGAEADARQAALEALLDSSALEHLASGYVEAAEACAHEAMKRATRRIRDAE